MKNIFEIMEAYGLELPEDKRKDFEKAVLENYKTVSDYNAQTDKLTAANEKIKANDAAIGDLKKQLEGLQEVDVSKLNERIAELETENKTLEANHQKQIADRDFNDLLKDSISAARGINAKAITALLDIETLKASKNQKEDVSAAIKALTEAEDSKMLFGEPEAKPIGTGSPIGDAGGRNLTTEEKEDADCRAAMGLPPVKMEGDK